MYFFIQDSSTWYMYPTHVYKYKSIRDAHQDMAKIGDSGGSVVIV